MAGDRRGSAPVMGFTPCTTRVVQFFGGYIQAGCAKKKKKAWAPNKATIMNHVVVCAEKVQIDWAFE